MKNIKKSQIALITFATVLSSSLMAKDLATEQQFDSSQKQSSETLKPKIRQIENTFDLGTMKLDIKKTQKSLDLNNLNMQKSMGTSHGGGGLTINGVPLEQYAKKTQQLKGWNLVVEPLMNSLKQKLPLFAELILENAEQATWYAVPVKMNKLPSQIQEVPFEEYNQDFINNQNEIFVNSSLNRTEIASGTLIFHEMIMTTLKNHPYFSEGKNSEECHVLTRKLAIYLTQNIYALTDTQLMDGITQITNIFKPISADVMTAILERALDNIGRTPEEKKLSKYGVLVTVSAIESFKRNQAIKLANESLINDKVKNHFEIPLAAAIAESCQMQMSFSEKISSAERLAKENPNQFAKILNLTKTVRNYLDQVSLLSLSEKEIINLCDSTQACDWKQITEKAYDGETRKAAYQFIGKVRFALSTSFGQNQFNPETDLQIEKSKNMETAVAFLSRKNIHVNRYYLDSSNIVGKKISADNLSEINLNGALNATDYAKLFVLMVQNENLCRRYSLSQ